MSENMEHWRGRTVDDRFPLESYLGGSDHSAVYLTLLHGGAGDSRKAAIKLIPAESAQAERQLLRWNAARNLNHPNLIRVFEAGRCEMEGRAVLYVVEEYAEENLSQILPERALTAEETRGMLPPVLGALRYLHEQGLAHGHIQPSNIMAIGEQVKLSSDALAENGSPGATTRAYDQREYDQREYDPPEAATGEASAAGDVWQLGMTLVEVLTQHLPAWDRGKPSAPDLPVSVGEPFREIAGHCLQVEPQDRWTVPQILSRVQPGRPVPVPSTTHVEEIGPPAIPPTTSAKWLYFLLLAVVLAIVVFLIARPKPSSPAPEVQSTQGQQGGTSGNSSPASTSADIASQPKPSAATPGEAKAVDEGVPANPHGGDVVRRVIPEVSMRARRTIHGTIKVRVKTEVDAAGNVTEAQFESSGQSKYFSRLAMDAAREWKFVPAHAGESGPREWTLQFAFSRGRTEASVVRTKR